MPKILDTISLIFYHGVIFYTQNQYFKEPQEKGSSCKVANPQLHVWFLVEIITFYGFIFSLVIYLMLASIWRVKRHELLLTSKYLRNDFLEWTKDIYYYFGLSSTLLCVSVAVYIIEKDQRCLANDGSTFMPTLITVIFIHSVQCFF